MARPSKKQTPKKPATKRKIERFLPGRTDPWTPPSKKEMKAALDAFKSGGSSDDAIRAMRKAAAGAFAVPGVGRKLLARKRPKRKVGPVPKWADPTTASGLKKKATKKKTTKKKRGR